ncbi:hypothetical protein [Streptomyces mirabilis]|uniref:hypothetical protein n=1 Tax=Streptomyces mirabilis TaxID=68239 RepID=UPI003683F430
MFRAITDTVYFQQWGELNRFHALPENVRARLSRLVAQDVGPDVVVASAFAHVDRATAYVFTPAGRTVAATEGARSVLAREAVALVANGAGITVPSTPTPSPRTSAGTCICPSPAVPRRACCTRSPRSWPAARSHEPGAGPPNTKRRTNSAPCSSHPAPRLPQWKERCGPAGSRPRAPTG